MVLLQQQYVAKKEAGAYSINFNHSIYGLGRLSSIRIAMWFVPGELWYLVGAGISIGERLR